MLNTCSHNSSAQGNIWERVRMAKTGATGATAQSTLPGQLGPLAPPPLLCVNSFFSTIFTLICFESIRNEQKNEIQ